MRIVELIAGVAKLAKSKPVVSQVFKLVTRNGDLEQGQRKECNKRRCALPEFRMVDCWRGLDHGSNIMHVWLQLQ